MNPRPGAAPAIEVGGSHVVGALADLPTGALVTGSARREVLDPAGSAADIVSKIIASGAILSVVPGERWGVAIPGPFDYGRGVGLFTGVGKFEALHGIDIGSALLSALPGPPGSIAFLNDAEAFAWGERLFGAASGARRCVVLTLGTGIGSAFLDGDVVRRSGPGIPPEGRADLITIDGRPLEEVVSTRAIEREYMLRTGVAPHGVAEVVALARTGDHAATTVLTCALRLLGAALRPFFKAFGPQALIVGGGMTGAWELIGPAFLHGIGADLADRMRISLPAHPQDAALLGAAAYAQGMTGGDHGD